MCTLTPQPTQPYLSTLQARSVFLTEHLLNPVSWWDDVIQLNILLILFASLVSTAFLLCWATPSFSFTALRRNTFKFCSEQKSHVKCTKIWWLCLLCIFVSKIWDNGPSFLLENVDKNSVVFILSKLQRLGIIPRKVPINLLIGSSFLACTRLLSSTNLLLGSSFLAWTRLLSALSNSPKASRDTPCLQNRACKLIKDDICQLSKYCRMYLHFQVFKNSSTLAFLCWSK